MRLLVVEDEVRIVEILTSALRKAGFTVDAATTSADAEEALSAIPYDAAILDLGLPDGDGLAVLADARVSGKQNADPPPDRQRCRRRPRLRSRCRSGRLSGKAFRDC
jgi:DNA-binding response OmpR family regulator